MPYFFWALVPPPSGIVPPLTMAWPPACFSASTMMTDDPASFAMIAAGNPTAPVPITTTSACKSQLPEDRPIEALAPTAPKLNAPIPRDPATTSRRVIEPLVFESLINASFKMMRALATVPASHSPHLTHIFGSLLPFAWNFFPKSVRSGPPSGRT